MRQQTTATHEDLFRAHGVTGPSNRAFGRVFTAVFFVIAVWPLLFGRPLRWWSLSVCGVFLLITVAAPALLAVPNRLWLRLGLLLHQVVSPVILAFLFYVVVTPTGRLMRVFGWDSLRLRDRNAEGSYWVKRDPPGPKPDSLLHPF